MDKKKRRIEEKENIKSWCLFGLCATCWLLFFHNIHKFRNMGKTFMQEFSFFAWLVYIDWFTPSLTHFSLKKKHNPICA
jgi:hypothetical protein